MDTQDGRDLRPYFTVTNEYPRHRKIRALSDRAFRLHVSLMALCNEDRNDGIIGEHDLNLLGPKPGQELVRAGLVDKHPDGYQLHDYLKHQKSAQQIQEAVARKAEAGSRGGKLGMHRRWHVSRGIFDPSCEFCPTDEPISEG